MVREITMFELHFDGARFGPSFGKGSEKESESAVETGDEADVDDSSGSKLRPVLAVFALVLVGVAIRRLAARRGGDDYDIPLEEGAETVQPDQ